MTQENMRKNRKSEFDAMFWSLNDKGQEATITVLKSLSFAQSVMEPSENELRPRKERGRS
ncbi:MAG: hypothetical protein HFI88_11415 [Lachnospiraceae bacterium]|nr:hypothetical protein [Lachnospiraceae bacterium]